MTVRAAVGILLSVAFLAGCQARLASLLPKTPHQQVIDMFNVNDADARRQGINEISSHDWGLREPYLEAYAFFATKDPEPTVRSAALVALARAGDTKYLPQVIQELADPVDQVRVDAATALIRLRGDAAIGPLEKHARQDADPDVRVRCIRALANYNRPAVLDTIASCLVDDAFAVRYEARKALEKRTGQNHGYDMQAWRAQLRQSRQSSQAQS